MSGRSPSIGVGSSSGEGRSPSSSAPISRLISSWCVESHGSPEHTMRHTLKLHGIIVGHSQLEEVVAADRRVWGQFHPGIGYELVQPIFRLFAEATPMPGGEPLDQIKVERYMEAGHKLPLELVDDTGKRIETAGIHIADYSVERGPDAISLDVLIKD